VAASFVEYVHCTLETVWGDGTRRTRARRRLGRIKRRDSLEAAVAASLLVDPHVDRERVRARRDLDATSPARASHSVGVRLSRQPAVPLHPRRERRVREPERRMRAHPAREMRSQPMRARGHIGHIACGRDATEPKAQAVEEARAIRRLRPDRPITEQQRRPARPPEPLQHPAGLRVGVRVARLFEVRAQSARMLAVASVAAHRSERGRWSRRRGRHRAGRDRKSTRLNSSH
jgi:hypothetical protein